MLYDDRSSRFLASLGLSAAFALGACGGDDGDGPPEPDATIGAPDAMADAMAAAAPGPITEFNAAADGPELALTWSNPDDADLAGVLVVQSADGPVSFTPTDGTSYAAGEDLGDGQSVIVGELATSAVLSDAPVGLELDFAAWAVDADGLYSEVAATASAARIALGSQTATLSIDVAGGEVTVVEQPESFTLTATFLAADTATGTLSFDLEAQNDTGRLIFNLKTVTDTLDAGAQSAPTLWTEDDKPYLYYGPESLAPGAAATRLFELTGIDGTTDPVTVELHLVDAPMIYGGNYGGDFIGVDTSMSGETFAIGFDNVDEAGEQLRSGVSSADGRYLFASEKRTPFLSVIDTTTLTVTGGTDLSTSENGEGNVGAVALSPDGSKLYLVFNDGSHWQGRSPSAGSVPVPTSVHLLELDAQTLTETQRLTLYTDDASSRTGRAIALDHDGARLAVALSDLTGSAKELWFVDLATFTAIDIDDSTAEPDPLVLTSPGQAAYLAWSDTTDHLAVGYNEHRAGEGIEVDVDIVDTASFAVTSVAPENGGTTASVMTARDGKLYYTARNGNVTAPLSIIDFATAAQVVPEIAEASVATGVVFGPNPDRYWVLDYETCVPMDTASNTPIDANGDDTDGVTPIQAEGEMRAHFVVVSPF